MFNFYSKLLLEESEDIRIAGILSVGVHWASVLKGCIEDYPMIWEE